MDVKWKGEVNKEGLVINKILTKENDNKRNNDGKLVLNLYVLFTIYVNDVI